MKPLLIALLAGPMLGCATPLLHEVALRDAGPQSEISVEGQWIDESQHEPAVSRSELQNYRSDGETTSVTAVLAGTVFDKIPPAKITLVAFNDGTAAASAAVFSNLGDNGSFGGAPKSDPEVHLLPEVNEPAGSGGLSAPGGLPVAGELSAGGGGGADNDPHGNVADITINTPPANALEAPGFSQYQDRPLIYNLLNDERNFYRCGSLEWLAVGLGGSAIMANTHIDEGFRDAYGESLRPGHIELDYFKLLGSGGYVIPGLAAIWVVDYEIDSRSEDGGYASSEWLQEWSGRSMRGLIVGAVPLVALQYIIGSNRPSDGGSSRWEPFKHDHGVSGHAFVCAVPFWTAAQMTDCCTLDVMFYTAGTLAGWSRLHTDSHYLSQVVMGWWLAALSVSAVDHTELQKRQWYVTPMVDDSGAGLALVHLH
jgi:hypothetical protein